LWRNAIALSEQSSFHHRVAEDSNCGFYAGRAALGDQLKL